MGRKLIRCGRPGSINPAVPARDGGDAAHHPCAVLVGVDESAVTQVVCEALAATRSNGTRRDGPVDSDRPPTMTGDTQTLAELSEQYKQSVPEDLRAAKTFEWYLQELREDPRIARNAHQRVADMFDHYGTLSLIPI